jgi:hypothetical protein
MQTGSAQNRMQHRLDLVVGRVGGNNAFGAMLGCDVGKEAIPRRPGRGF